VSIVGAIGQKRPSAKVVWISAAIAISEAEAESASRLAAWWKKALLKRAPVLEGGDGTQRGPIFYGRQSGYGEKFAKRMSAQEFYINFRFAREEIPRLVKALKIPKFWRTKNGCVLDGEEGLLMYLKRLSYPDRHLNLVRFFGRSTGFISGMVDRVREYLDVVAARLLRKFDWRRLVPLAPVFAKALRDKGHPLYIIIFFLDGVFEHCCRPFDPIFGYRSLKQRAIYNGSKREHGIQYQASSPFHQPRSSCCCCCCCCC
jgi:hypothetical protein